MCAVAVEEPATLERWSCVSIGTKDFLDIADAEGAAPPACSVRTRVTTDMHTQELIATHKYKDGKPVATEQAFPTDVDSVDTLTYFYYSPQQAHECGWQRTPTGIRTFSSPSSLYHRDSVEVSTSKEGGGRLLSDAVH